MIGQRVPDITFKTRVKDEEGNFGWKDVTTCDYFKGKSVILFSLPGAFTPTCSTYQLPNFEKKFAEFSLEGIDEIYCMSVNDAFVMNAWFRDQNIKKVKPIGDGEGKFTKGMGMLVDKPKQGFGMRSWRYSALIDNCKVSKIFIEDGKNNHSQDNDPFKVSDVDTMLEYLKK